MQFSYKVGMRSTACCLILVLVSVVGANASNSRPSIVFDPGTGPPPRHSNESHGWKELAKDRKDNKESGNSLSLFP